MLSQWVTFTVAITGRGQIPEAVTAMLKDQYPGIVIYDRIGEKDIPDADDGTPYIPQVAYMDILFLRRGDKEQATVRCFHQHRFFNYDLSETEAGSKREEKLLNSIMMAVAQLQELPKANPIDRYVPPEPEDTDGADEAAGESGAAEQAGADSPAEAS